jgi:glutathione S-transferase
MKLIGSRNSPYVRKVRVLLAEKSLAFEFVEEDVWNADTKMARYNPLVKVPALVLDDGESIYDSVVVAEYVDTLPGARFIPAAPVERARVRRDEALGDGIADAGITIFLERKREAARQDPTWIARQREKVESGIATVAKSVAAKAGPMTLGDIACGCALFWLEFRLPEFRWREDPALKSWAATLESRASFAATRPG